ncbi:hypothetical protein LOK74_11120 [Brevibacillus humidisoli]|uniref:hypothetical protein n=1 Tax=Brevibacillus humidisoli TaxID=2895522 RepID=UPI001E4AC9C2|nr:hypothetical protein [Brevibacillus humidisoli]UFJ43000.1 hypothetical protein LOK74_11120 [Brevibacillus humidisoli]
MSKDQEELAWKMASQSVSTEEIGLLISARLLQEAEDAPTRLCLATAVSDEAKHCEVFARFSISCGGFIEKPAQYADNLRNAPPKVQTNFCCFTLERFPTT